ncbi:MAG: response regulator [Nanoarchaeota archaeon]|nr:response regulator [Nanoarchaeota archaeon]
MAKGKILIVDDEPHLVELLTAILEAEGYNVTAATNGPDALDRLKNLKPDLVILDMMMPGMSGREVCEKIRAEPKTKNLNVMFLTVAKFSETGKKVLDDMKVQGYLTKPFENDDLLKHVKKIIG